MARNQHNAYDSARAGMVATGVVGSLTSGFGANVPNHVANYASGFAGTKGFDWSAKFHGFIIAGLLFFVGVPLLIDHFGQEHKWVATLALPGIIVWCVGAFAYSIAFIFASSTYLAMKLKCRLYPVDEPNHTYGLSVTGNPLVDAIFITPFRLALYLIMLPFILVGSVLEVLRVILLNLAGKDHVSYRGDQGKYYEKVRKHYAKVYHQSGVAAAKDYLRMAYSGMLTPLGEEIPPSMWTNAHIEQWLAPMIHRHGPIDKYCHGAPGNAVNAPGNIHRQHGSPGNAGHTGGIKHTLPNGQEVDNRTFAKIDSKYSAI